VLSGRCSESSAIEKSEDSEQRSRGRSEPIVRNGSALCKLRHAALDAYILSVCSDCVIEVRSDILGESDGPMLRYGLQEIAGQQILLPGSQQLHPRRHFLEERHEMFRKAS
jgi:putative restriction endonuclease